VLDYGCPTPKKKRKDGMPKKHDPKKRKRESNGAPHWEREKFLWEQEQMREWTKVQSKRQKKSKVSGSARRVHFATRLVQPSPTCKHQPTPSPDSVTIGAFKIPILVKVSSVFDRIQSDLGVLPFYSSLIRNFRMFQILRLPRIQISKLTVFVPVVSLWITRLKIVSTLGIVKSALIMDIRPTGASPNQNQSFFGPQQVLHGPAG